MSGPVGEGMGSFDGWHRINILYHYMYWNFCNCAARNALMVMVNTISLRDEDEEDFSSWGNGLCSAPATQEAKDNSSILVLHSTRLEHREQVSKSNTFIEYLVGSNSPPIETLCTNDLSMTDPVHRELQGLRSALASQTWTDHGEKRPLMFRWAW